MAHIAIIGGGPAGLMAAQTLAPTHDVHLYERMPTLGRKFLMAGRGGLNLTHCEPLDVFLTRYGVGGEWLRPMIEAFGPEDLRRWAHDLGEETFIGSSGRVFPKSFKASPLLRAWAAHLAGLGITFHMRHEWRGWDDEGRLLFDTPNTEKVTVKTDAVLLALGGASWPRLGSDGKWADYLEQAGVALLPFAPSNAGCQIAWSDHFRQRFEGEPLKNITLTCGGQSARGDAVVTRTGLEGGPVYALSGAIRAACEAGPGTLQIDLRSDQSAERLAARFAKQKAGQSLSNALRKVGLSPIAANLLREARGKDVPRAPEELAASIKSVPLTVTGLSGLERAISSVGGIPRDALDEHLMLTAKPGTFIAGEMVDWDAPTGGYLLQGCFSSALAAARGVEAWLNTKPSAPLSGQK